MTHLELTALFPEVDGSTPLSSGTSTRPQPSLILVLSSASKSKEIQSDLTKLGISCYFENSGNRTFACLYLNETSASDLAERFCYHVPTRTVNVSKGVWWDKIYSLWQYGSFCYAGYYTLSVPYTRDLGARSELSTVRVQAELIEATLREAGFLEGWSEHVTDTFVPHTPSVDTLMGSSKLFPLHSFR